MGTGIQSIIRNGAFLMGSNWVETGLRALYLVAITRYLGAELYGIWAYGAAAYGLAIGLIGFGFDTLLPIRLGASKRDAAGFAGVTLTLRLGLLALAGAGLAAYAFLGEPAGTTRLILFALIPALFGRGLSMWVKVLFLGYEQVGTYVKMAATLRLAEVVCGVALLVSGGGLLGIVIVHSLAWVTEAAIGMRLVRSRLMPCRPRFDLHQAAELLRHGAVLGLATALTTWLIAGPLLLLRHVDGDLAKVGQLGLSLQITMILVASVQPFLAAALPVLSRSAARGDPRVGSFGKVTALMALLASGVAAGLGFTLGPPLMTWAFGPEFALSGKLLGPCLLIGGLIVAPSGYMQVLVLRGRRWPGAIASGSGGLVLLVALPPAVAYWGVNGAVFATGMAWLARAVILMASAMTRSNTDAQIEP